MNKFKIGDKVRLRDDLKVGEEYGEVSFSSSMNKLKGKELTIEGMSLKGNYEIEESYFFLSDEMLEKVNDVNTDNLLEFALDKFGISKEELEEEYKKNKIKEQELEDMKNVVMILKVIVVVINVVLIVMFVNFKNAMVWMDWVLEVVC